MFNFFNYVTIIKIIMSYCKITKNVFRKCYSYLFYINITVKKEMRFIT